MFIVAALALVPAVPRVAASGPPPPPDFTVSCTQSGTTITCTATDHDGYGGPSGHGTENGVFVVFIGTGGASNLVSSEAFCAWTSTASGATTPVNCNYGGIFVSVSGSSLSNTGGAVFTLNSGASGSVTFDAVDCVSGSPSSSQTSPCTSTGPGAIDGSDCTNLGVWGPGSTCATTVNISRIQTEFQSSQSHLSALFA